jgi:hypothetical protein
MFKTFPIKLDIEKDIYSPMQILFEVSNSDDAVQLLFEFVQDETPFDLTGKTVQLAIQNPSLKVFYQDVQIENPTLGKASTTLSKIAYDQSGIHTAEIYIKDIDNTIVTSPFYFTSRSSIIQTETIPVGTETVTWDTVLNKPSFFPPEIHNHNIADVTGLQTALNEKADVGDVGVPADHTHEILDVTGLQTALDSKVDDAEMTGKADVNHDHAIADVTGLSLALDGKADDLHNHAINDVTGLQTALDGKIGDEEWMNKANAIHTHAIGDVTGLQTALDSKLEGLHTHTIGEVTGLQNALDSKVDDADLSLKADLDHDHGIADVGGLQIALDGKADKSALDLKANIGDSYLKTETYAKTELYNRTEVDQMTMGAGGGSPVIVEDNLVSTSPTNALSSNQGRILDETKADAIHTHALGDVADLEVELSTKADVNHNHDLQYSSINHNHDLDYATKNHTHTEYAPTVHNHDLDYADINHTHTEYATTVHTHAIGDVTGLQTALDGKADDLHTHAIADVTGLSTALDGKADDLHTHALGDVTGLSLELDGKADVNHGHAIADVTGLSLALDGKADTTHNHDLKYADINHNHDLDYADINHNHDLDYADINHTHLDLAPINHDHAIADVTGLQLALDGKMDDGDAYLKTETYNKSEVYNRTEIDQMTMGAGEVSPVIVEDNLMSTSPTNALSSNQGRILNETKAPIDHDHAIADVTGLQLALDGKVDDAEMTGKADVNHTHDFDSITGKPLAYPSIAHFHEIADVNGLSTALDGKVDDAEMTGKADVNHTHDDRYLQNTGGTVNGQVTINNKGDNVELLRFDTDRAWSFKQKGVLGDADLVLQADSNGKSVFVQSPLNVNALEVRVDDVVTGAYIDAPEIRENGVKLADKYAPIGTTGGGTAEPHTHAIADVTGLESALNLKADRPVESASVPTTPTIAPRYAGDVVIDTAQKRSFIATGQTVTDWERLAPTSYVDTADNFIINDILDGLSFWKGTQAEYDAIITKNTSTMYFIVG